MQFCANDPATLLAAAKLVEGRCDGVDLNLGCPQRIAKKGNYGAFLMDDLERVRAMVETLAQNLSVPVTVKARSAAARACAALRCADAVQLSCA